jgi:hypothetical protein
MVIINRNVSNLNVAITSNVNVDVVTGMVGQERPILSRRLSSPLGTAHTPGFTWHPSGAIETPEPRASYQEFCWADGGLSGEGTSSASNRGSLPSYLAGLPDSGTTEDCDYQSYDLRLNAVNLKRTALKPQTIR